MTLTIQTEEDEQRQLKMKIEVAEDRVQKAMRQEAKKVARNLNIPGFRRGKAPYNVVVRYVGEEALRSEVVEKMLPSVFEEALTQSEVEPYAPANLDDMELSPLSLSFTIPLDPQVNLGDYRSLRKEIESVNITEEAVEEALKRIQLRHQVLEPVERPVETGDVVTISGQGHVKTDDDTEGQALLDEESIDFHLEPDALYFGQGFIDNLVGLSVGDEKEFEITLPESKTSEATDEESDEEAEVDELAGKEAIFKVTVLEVKSRYLPEIDDDLAQEEGDYETLTELKEALAERLQKQAEDEAKGELFDGMMADMIAMTELVYSPAVVEMELNDIVKSLKDQVTRSGWNWDDYLQLQGETEESLRVEFKESAVERVQRGLVLRKFIELEKIHIHSEELDAAFNEQFGSLNDDEETKQRMKDLLFSQGFGNQIRNQLLLDKVSERMKAILSGEAPDLDSLEDEIAHHDEISEEE